MKKVVGNVKAVDDVSIVGSDLQGNVFKKTVDYRKIERDARKKVNGKLEKCEMPEDKKDQVEVLRSMLIEVAAESSEELMEKFFNDEELTEEEIYDGLQVGIANHSIAPVMCGSATLGYGVKLLMNTIVRFTLPAIEAKANFHAFHDGKESHPWRKKPHALPRRKK